MTEVHTVPPLGALEPPSRHASSPEPALGCRREGRPSLRPSPTRALGGIRAPRRNTSLFCLRVHHQPRKAAIRFVESRCFDPVILVTILANCTTMAWESPLDPEGTAKAHFIAGCEKIFLAIYPKVGTR